ncbi:MULTISPECIES: DUF3006 domain-containing protein [Halorussus]|uniref:DUF3006 domain-containing protein n=1 Tax=Halorussus TaxID=1070314 RepID=UPI000E20E409|nr:MULTISPECIES: DUF3006 domain-containing protein [Halorussus]NHN58606.1 DUF3006 domain-containing protein [Halorussus sp. JP-T4]
MTGDRNAPDRSPVPDGGGSERRDAVPDGRYVAVLDRFEATDPADDGRELAVLLLESGEEVVAERAIPAWRLPEDARRQDAVLELAVSSGHVTSLSYDPDATERRADGAQSRFDALAERPESDAAGETDESADGSDESADDAQ